MPHIIVEFTHGVASDAQVESMLDALHTAIKETSLFDERHIRVRATPLRFHRCGGTKAPFIHAQLRIHAGRSNEQKRRLSYAILAILQEQEWPARDITVEVVEMDGTSYSKYTSY